MKSVACGNFCVGDRWQGREIASLDTVNLAISDVAVKPAFLDYAGVQVLAYYDQERCLTISYRRSGVRSWSVLKTDSTVNWDSHRGIELGVDLSGVLHIAGNMHASPLNYWVVDLSDETPRLLAKSILLDSKREQRVTYPRFLRDARGRLLFAYREGSSGDGDFRCLRWNEVTSEYDLVGGGPLVSGEGKRNAYLDQNAPILGPDDRWHMVWVWRDSPEAESTHTVCYVSSSDLVHWKDVSGTPIPLPITHGSRGLVTIDPVPQGAGLINNNARLGFLPDGSPLVVYHRRDVDGYQQIWAATFVGMHWIRRQVTHWKFRWDFSGKGSLDFELEIGTPVTTPAGIKVAIRRTDRVDVLHLNHELSLVSVDRAGPWSPLRRGALANDLYQRIAPIRHWLPGSQVPEWFALHTTVPDQRDRQPEGPDIGPTPLVVMRTSPIVGPQRYSS